MSPSFVVYAERPSGPLRLWSDRPGAEPAPTLILFHGGGWNSGTPDHFRRQAESFREQGYAVLLPEYRLRDRDGVGPVEQQQDAHDALVFIRDHARALGVDLHRLILGGASAGGQLALMTQLCDAAPLRPRGLLLYNPVVDTGPGGCGTWHFASTHPRFSPIAQLRAGLPPIRILHGELDTVVPLERLQAFIDKARALGNSVDRVLYPGYGHGFEDCLYERPPFEEALARSTRDALAFVKSLTPAPTGFRCG